MKGQQAMETVIIVSILAVLFFLGVFFYAKLSDYSQEDQEQTILRQELFSAALQLSHMPELSCTSEGGQTRTCIDKIKLEYFSQAVNNPQNVWYDERAFLRYLELFGRIHVEIYPLYPEEEDMVVVLSTNTTQEGVAQAFPLLLYNAIEDRNEFAMIRVYKQ